MYMVISKPKRMSLAAGVCHFMVNLLNESRKLRLFVNRDILNTSAYYAGVVRFGTPYFKEFGLMKFMMKA